MFSLDATVSPDNAYNQSLSWISSDNDVATVSDGNVTAVAPGECDIICAAADGSNVSASCHVTVNAAPRYWLTVKVPNGSYSMDVTDMEEISIMITPDDGYRVHSVTLNGVPLTDEESSSIYTITKLENDATLNAVFEDAGVSTYVNGITQDENLSVSVNGNTITVSGMTNGEAINVYNINGSLIKSTTAPSFELPAGVYLFRVSNRTFKIAI